MPRVILISGGSDGLGKAIAKKLTPKDQVVILAHNKEKLESAAKEIGCDFVECELTDFQSLKSAVEQVIKKYNAIDILINNAGVWAGGSLIDTSSEKINEVIDVNTTGTILLTKAVLPYLISNNSGLIINIISQDGLISKKDRSVYSASKWAITGFSKCLREDLSETNIKVTGVYPGLMATSLFEKNGVNRDLSDALDANEVASLIETVINLSPGTHITDIGITNKKNNTKNMDDTNTPVIDLNIDPDMITPQGDSPQPLPKTVDPVVSNPNVIDITPGSISTPPISSPISNNIDITPPVEPKTPDITPTAISTPPISAPVPVEPNQIDITPPITPFSQPINIDQPPQTTTPVSPQENQPAPSISEDPDLVKLVK